MELSYKIIEDKNWDALEQRFDWVRDMSHVSQHKIHHAEGNVAIHTQLVIKNLSTIEGYNELNNLEKEILWTAALLHDVEKRSTSIDYGHGLISAKGHAEKGEFTARTVLYRDIAVPFHIREQVASLVRLHGLPLWFQNTNNPDSYIKSASLRVDTRLLAILSEADAKGRICEDPKELSASLSAFKLRCKTLDCWGRPAYFESEEERFQFFNPDLCLAESKRTGEAENNVFILMSLPYINRSVYIQEHFSNLPFIKVRENLLNIDRDLLETFEKQIEICLKDRLDFMIDGSNMNQFVRLQMIKYLALKGYKTHIVYIEKEYDKWIDDMKETLGTINDFDIRLFLKRFQMPQLTDAHNLIYSID